MQVCAYCTCMSPSPSQYTYYSNEDIIYIAAAAAVLDILYSSVSSIYIVPTVEYIYHTLHTYSAASRCFILRYKQSLV